MYAFVIILTISGSCSGQLGTKGGRMLPKVTSPLFYLVFHQMTDIS